jgi:UDP-N-acetylmuramoyl-tripeptide--D-alanyl-D-alanine ligase
MIKPYLLAELAKPLAGQYVGPDKAVSFNQVSIDSRQMQPGDLFIALKGPHFDGHHFLAKAQKKGAAGAIVSQPPAPGIAASLPHLLVKDTRLALGQLAKLHRQQFNGPLIAVTGSNGKTSVKEMIASILRQKGPCLATQGNFNNEIGVPLTLLQLTAEQRFGILELGASQAGDIAYTSALVEPQVAIITLVNPAHLEGFGSLDGIAAAKGEIIDSLKPQGTFILNQDDPYAHQWRDRAAHCSLLSFSLTDRQADFSATDIKLTSQGCYQFSLHSPQGSMTIKLPLRGKHNIANALAAAAACYAIDLPLDIIKAGLEQATPVAGRLKPVKGYGGALILDDSYNANPGSVRAAITALADCAGSKFLVLGDMAELGEEGPQLHHNIGEYARQQGIDYLFSVGELSALAAQAFGQQGQSYADQPALVAALKPLLNHQSVVLVKGSFSSHMGQVVQQLTTD